MIGVDEVGRGALAGPVVVCAAWFDPARLDAALLADLDDSKLLTARMRGALASRLRLETRWALGAASVAAISVEGVRGATLSAMSRAVRRLGMRAPLCVDGRDAPEGCGPVETLIGGERLRPQIAAASIIAKEARDAVMRILAERRPGFGWERNAGYGVAAHLAALRALGPTPHHRPSFAPVREAAAAHGAVRTSASSAARQA